MKRFSAMLAAMLLLLVGRRAGAQVPFYYGGATGYEAQISTVNTGVVLDAQATVSADRKYVTMTMRPQNSSLLALQSFSYQQAAGPAEGFVGMGVAAPAPTATSVRTLNFNSVAAPPPKTSVLQAVGMIPIQITDQTVGQ